MAKMVCRVGDKDEVHCPGSANPVRYEGVATVLAEGQLISCQTHKNNLHDMPNPGTPPPKCVPHQAAIVIGSKTVFAQGLGVGRVGDQVGPNCTKVMEGSATVLAGG